MVLVLSPALARTQSRLDNFIQEVIRRTPGHCGTETALQIARERRAKSVAILDATPQMSDSVLSPTGRFKVFYDDTGKDVATLEYAAFVAATADTAYFLEVDTLGYPKPPFAFPDSTWHIYLKSLGSAYGMTAPTDDAFLGASPTGLQRSRSFITIDHAFREDKYPTKGLDAARITIFHEFHHVIQFADYGNSAVPGDVNFREMTSTAMEMRSSPWIRDYEQYLATYLPNLNKTITLADNSGGYGQCIWLNYLAKKIADSVIREFWQYYANTQANYLLAFDSVLGRHGSAFCERYRMFGLDMLTMQRTYFPSAALPISRSHLELLPVTIYELDTSVIMDPASLILALHHQQNASSALVAARNTDFSTITTLDISAGSATGWSSDHPEKFCAGISAIRGLDLTVFPQPFVVGQGENATLNILASGSGSKPTSSELRIYSAGQALVRYIDQPPLLNGGSWYINWDGLDDIGRPVGSGIYYYSLKTDGTLTQGKIAVVRK